MTDTTATVSKFYIQNHRFCSHKTYSMVPNLVLCIKDNMQLRSPHGLWGMYATDTPAYGKNSLGYSLDIIIQPGSMAVQKSQDQKYMPCGT
jgi:hypothetical protein